MALDSLLAIADGVGGTILDGIDSGIYSKQLVYDMKALHESDKTIDTKELLINADEPNTHIGSAVVVLAKLHHEESQ